MSIDTIIDFKLNSKSVGAKIEEIVLDNDVNYIEASLMAAEEYKIEPEHMQKYIPKTIKEKIEIQARELHMLKKGTSNPLPLK